MKITPQLIALVRANNPTVPISIFINVNEDNEQLCREFLEAIKHNHCITDLTVYATEEVNVHIFEVVLQTAMANDTLLSCDYNGATQTPYMQKILSKLEENKKARAIQDEIALQQLQKIPTEEWRCFIARSELLKQSHRNKDGCVANQESWAKLCYMSVLRASAYLKDNIRTITCEQLYFFLLNERHHIARLQREYVAHLMGVLRDERQYAAPTTVIPSKPSNYGDFYTPLKAKLQENCSFGSYVSSLFFKTSLMIDIKVDDIQLCRIQLRDNYPEPQIDVTHPPISEFPKIMRKVEPIFQTYLREDTSPRDKLRCIAKLVRWFAQGMFGFRGSAAATEKFCRTLMHHAHFKWVPYSNLIPLDFEAIFEPNEEKFADKFIDFFPGILSQDEKLISSKSL